MNHGMGIKCNLNENIECHCMQIELSSNASNGILIQMY
jgi:hypothetical protein